MNDNQPDGTDRRRISARGRRLLVCLGAVAAAGASGLLLADQASTPLHPSLVAAAACLVVWLGRQWVASHPRAAVSIEMVLLTTAILAWVATPRIAHPDLLMASMFGVCVCVGVVAIHTPRFGATPRMNEPRGTDRPAPSRIELSRAVQNIREHGPRGVDVLCTLRCWREDGAWTGVLEVSTFERSDVIDIVVPAELLDEASLRRWVETEVHEPLESVGLTDDGIGGATFLVRPPEA
jgi:hypothetical protein